MEIRYALHSFHFCAMHPPTPVRRLMVSSKRIIRLPSTRGTPARCVVIAGNQPPGRRLSYILCTLKPQAPQVSATVQVKIQRMDARHQCMIYEGSPSIHLPGLAAAIVENLKVNRRCIFLNSAPMIAGWRSCLAATGLDVPAAVQSGVLVLSSGTGHLIDGRFDVDNMLALLSHQVDDALTDGYSALWVSGDMTWEFGPERDFAKLREYERRLEELFHDQPALEGICQYHVDTLTAEAIDEALYSHSACYINETLSKISPFYIAQNSSRSSEIPVGMYRSMLAVPATATAPDS